MWEMEPRLILADPLDQTAPDAPDAPGRRTGGTIRRLRTRRALVLAALIAALEAVAFGLYLVGLSVPPWDFFGSYNTDAYLWWSRGGVFDPVDWIPTLWAGYPAAAVLQNSAWYLPVGIAAAFGPFTLHSAAVVQALTWPSAPSARICSSAAWAGPFRPRCWRRRHGSSPSASTAMPNTLTSSAATPGCHGCCWWSPRCGHGGAGGPSPPRPFCSGRRRLGSTRVFSSPPPTFCRSGPSPRSSSGGARSRSPSSASPSARSARRCSRVRASCRT